MSAHDWFMHGVLAGLALGCIAALLGRRSRIRERRRREQARTFPWKSGEVTITAPMSEAEYEEIRARWQKLHGNNQTAHHVKVLRPADEEPQP